MKFIALDKMLFKTNLIITMLVMLTLTIFSMHAFAAPADSSDSGPRTQADRFDHTATGYPLTGSHATIAECGSCHVGGVFKGTPRNCNGCHSRGQRVVALTMSSNHFPTTQPCDICHTNTVTFLGARYNHGMSIPGQCGSCHNGTIATARPASHNTNTFKASYSCDKCHRSAVWLPSFWNHVGAISQCGGCHATGQPGAAFVKTNIGGTSAEGFAHGALNNAIDCVSCHHNYSNWLGATYDHASAGGTCLSCHNGSKATGTAQFTGHLPTTLDCGSCHHGYASWLGATFDHTGVSTVCSSCHNGTTATGKNQVSGTSPEAFAHSALNNSIECGGCHTTANWLGALYSHSGPGYSGTCSSCHGGAGTRATGTAQFASHVAITGECNTCHISTTTWLGAAGAMPSNHIPFNSGTACATCHIKDYVTIVATTTLHNNATSSTCAVCHISPNAYTGNNQQTKKTHCGSSGSNCSNCHKKASTYVNWSDSGGC
jgi:hypothetical protein